MTNSLADLESYKKLMKTLEDILAKSDRNFGSLVTTLTGQMSNLNTTVSETSVKVEESVKNNIENTELLQSKLMNAQGDTDKHLGVKIDRMDTVATTFKGKDEAMPVNTENAFIREMYRKNEYEQYFKISRVYNWKPEVNIEFKIAAERFEIRGRFGFNITFRVSVNASYMLQAEQGTKQPELQYILPAQFGAGEREKGLVYT